MASKQVGNSHETRVVSGGHATTAVDSLACVLVGSHCDSLTWLNLGPNNLGDKSWKFTLTDPNSKKRVKAGVGDPVSLEISLSWGA